MKRITLIALAIIIVALVGCTPNAQFVRAIDRHTAIILPEYVALVEASGMSDTTKKIRIESADTLAALIQTAKAEVAPDAQ